jgi:RNA polymerase sigma-70 factor (ECF subfamily)
LNNPLPTHQPTDPATWVDQYGDYLYAFALSRVRNPSTAEEVVQETLLAALGARKNYKKQSSEKTWITGILKHKIMDHFRKHAKEQRDLHIDSSETPLETFFTENGQWRDKPALWAADPHELYKQKEFLAVLYYCLSVLPARQSDVFTLREMDGLSTDEICKFYDISATNCWVILHRARMFLRSCVEKNWFNDPKQ